MTVQPHECRFADQKSPPCIFSNSELYELLLNELQSLKGMDHQKASTIPKKINVNSFPLYCLEHVRKFQENRTNIFWTMPLCLSKHFLSSANILLSIYKIEKITRTVLLLKSNYTFFFSRMDIKNIYNRWGSGSRVCFGSWEIFFWENNYIISAM